MLAGMHAAAFVSGAMSVAPPRVTALGSLIHYITHAEPKKFQPANITFDLLSPLEKKIRDRKERHRMQCELALDTLAGWLRADGKSQDAVERAS